MVEHWELVLIFLLIAGIYASVGFGGGSSYLAVMVLYAFPFQEMRLIALICNIIVVTTGTITFIGNGQVNWRKVLPIALVSIPMAFLGAMIPLKQEIFFLILGCSLLVAGILLWVKKKARGEYYLDARTFSPVMNALIGGSIGFLSGLVGIGGGIFLSPVLNLTRWDTPKKIAATASFFILVNSVAGLIGQLTKLPPHINGGQMTQLCVAVYSGGLLGSRISAARFSLDVVKRVTAILVSYAGLELLSKHLHLFS